MQNCKLRIIVNPSHSISEEYTANANAQMPKTGVEHLHNPIVHYGKYGACARGTRIETSFCTRMTLIAPYGACVLAGDDDDDDGVWDDGDEDVDELVDHAHDESMVSGFMGMVDMTLFDE
jgi:hypothetical protein